MEEAPESTQEWTGEDGEIDDGESESEDGPIDLTLAGAEDSDEEAATEAKRDNPSCSSEPPDESTWDTTVRVSQVCVPTLRVSSVCVTTLRILVRT